MGGILHVWNLPYIENNTWARRDVEFVFECSH